MFIVSIPFSSFELDSFQKYRNFRWGNQLFRLITYLHFPGPFIFKKLIIPNFELFFDKSNFNYNLFCIMFFRFDFNFGPHKLIPLTYSFGIIILSRTCNLLDWWCWVAAFIHYLYHLDTLVHNIVLSCLDVRL